MKQHDESYLVRDVCVAFFSFTGALFIFIYLHIQVSSSLGRARVRLMQSGCRARARFKISLALMTERAFRHRQTSSNLNANEARLNSPRFQCSHYYSYYYDAEKPPLALFLCDAAAANLVSLSSCNEAAHTHIHKASIDLCIEREEERRPKKKKFCSLTGKKRHAGVSKTNP